MIKVIKHYHWSTLKEMLKGCVYHALLCGLGK